jgi:hypothetical protein
MKGKNPAGLTVVIPSTYKVPVFNNDPSVAGSQFNMRKRQASDTDTPIIPSKRNTQNENK